MAEAGVRHATANAQKELAKKPNPVTLILALMRSVAVHADVIGWQEIESAEHRLALRQLGGWKTHWFEGSAAAIPISWRKDRFTYLRGGQLRIHKGQAGVTPERWFVWVVLRDHLTGRVVVRWNTHLISQAFSSHPERRLRWRTGEQLIVRQNRRLVKKYGAVVGGGDFNRSHWAPTGTTGVWASEGTHGPSVYYDALTVAGKAGVDGPVLRIQTPSDHDALVANIRSAA